MEEDKTVQYWKAFYELYDTLPIEIKVELMEQTTCPRIADLVEAKEKWLLQKQFEDMFSDDAD